MKTQIMTVQVFVLKALQIIAQLRILHWQTQSYARHKAFEDTYEGIADSLDEFVEVYQGKNGRIIFGEEEAILSLTNINSESLNDFLQSFSADIANDMGGVITPEDTDLANIRDEILSRINKTRYLLTLS